MSSHSSLALPRTGTGTTGILLTCLAVMLFASHDALAKYLGGIYPLLMVAWVRFTSQTLVMSIFFGPRRDIRLLKTSYPGLQLLRALLLIATSLCFVSGLRYLPLAEMSALHGLSPLLLTATSVVVLGERVSRGQWLAVLGGFVGVLIIMRPGGALFSPAMLFPLGSATFFALYQLLTQRLCRTEDATTCNFISGLLISLLVTLLLPFYWQTPSLPHMLLMLGMGACGTCGHLLMSKSYRYASPATLAPFSYGQIVCAGILGVLFFNHVPDHWTMAGITIIIASGLIAIFCKRSETGLPSHSRPARTL